MKVRAAKGADLGSNTLTHRKWLNSLSQEEECPLPKGMLTHVTSFQTPHIDFSFRAVYLMTLLVCHDNLR